MLLSVFSPLWFILFAADAALVVVFTCLLKGLDLKGKTKVLLALAVFNLLYWVFYKFMLSKDPTFDFQLPLELPFHLCNLNSMLMIVALLTKKPGLLNFCYCFGIFGAFLALLSPDPAFVNIGLFSSVKGYGYWLYHHILIVQSILLVSTGFYRPGYREVPKSYGILLVLYFGMFLINLTLRKLTGIPVNYLYTFGMPGNPALEMLYKILPVYPLYLVPALLPMVPLCFGLVALGRLSKGCKDTIHS